MGRGLSPLQKWMLYAARSTTDARKSATTTRAEPTCCCARSRKSCCNQPRVRPKWWGKVFRQMQLRALHLHGKYRSPRGFHRAGCDCGYHDPDPEPEPLDPLAPNATPEERWHHRTFAMYHKNPAIDVSIVRARKRLEQRGLVRIVWNIASGFNLTDAGICAAEELAYPWTATGYARADVQPSDATRHRVKKTTKRSKNQDLNKLAAKIRGALEKMEEAA